MIFDKTGKKRVPRKKRLLFRTYFSHWSRCAPEANDLLWRQYAGDDFKGVAIKSRTETLINAIPPSLREVIRSDGTDDWRLIFDDDTLLDQHGLDKAFTFVMGDDLSTDTYFKCHEGSPFNDLIGKKGGYLMKLPLLTIIEGIYIHPDAPAEYQDEIRQIWGWLKVCCYDVGVTWK